MKKTLLILAVAGLTIAARAGLKEDAIKAGDSEALIYLGLIKEGNDPQEVMNACLHGIEQEAEKHCSGADVYAFRAIAKTEMVKAIESK